MGWVPYIDEVDDDFHNSHLRKLSGYAIRWLGVERGDKLTFRMEKKDDILNLVIDGPDEIKRAFDEAEQKYLKGLDVDFADEEGRVSKRQNPLLAPLRRYDIVCPRFRCKVINKRVGDPAYVRELLRLAFHRDRQGFDLDLVTPASVKSARMAAQCIATYFQREFTYDFVGYRAAEPWNRRDRVLLWTYDEVRFREAIGAICFRWRDRSETPHLALAWVWIHPFLRRDGILSAWWPLLRELYGNFVVEPPLTHAMESFLRRKSECGRHGPYSGDACIR